MDQHLEDTVKQIDCISPHCNLDLEDSEPILLHDILSLDNTPPYQVWLKMVVWCRRYQSMCLHTQKDQQLERQMQ